MILDHITASWGVDETVSVTSSSNNVTVQWSTMTQGLYNAGHSDEDGVGHSYGSLLNGGNYSFHHNLYAHSKSRHPRAQRSGDARHAARLGQQRHLQPRRRIRQQRQRRSLFA